MAKQYEIKDEVITIEAGVAQADALEIDSPIIELMPSTISDKGIELGMFYTYMQGTVKNERHIVHSIPIEDLNESELAAVLAITEKAHERLLAMYPNATLIK